MLYTYRFRLYPNKEDEILLQKHFGCCRFIYNYLLWYRQTMYETTGKGVSWGESQSVIAKLKKLEEYSWLKEVNSQSLQFAHHCLKRAFERFFAKKASYPRHKKKDGKKSFTVPQNVFLEERDSRYGLLILPKFRNGIKVRIHRKIEGKIKFASLVQECSGEFYVNVVVERDDFQRYEQIDGEIGIDLGLTAFLTKDDGVKVSAPRYLRKMERRLIIAQRKLAKKRKSSGNYEKMRCRVAILHQKVKNQRKHFLHVESFRLINENQVIYVEDLHVAGMIRNHCLAKSIADAGWSKFVTYVLYKAEWYGRKVVFVDRFAPSSKLCSECGSTSEELKLSDRMWCCKICHTEHDRDINAAKNIKKLGQGIVRSKKPEERTVNTFLAKEKQAGSRIQEPFLQKQDAR